MLSACLFTVLLFHPASPVRALVPSPFVRRLLMGLAMGGTAVGLNYSAWGKQSGAHYNPAVTLTFARLGRIAPRDAAAYVAAQFAGAVLRRPHRDAARRRAGGRTRRSDTPSRCPVRTAWPSHSSRRWRSPSC